MQHEQLIPETRMRRQNFPFLFSLNWKLQVEVSKNIHDDLNNWNRVLFKKKQHKIIEFATNPYERHTPKSVKSRVGEKRIFSKNKTMMSTLVGKRN